MRNASYRIKKQLVKNKCRHVYLLESWNNKEVSFRNRQLIGEYETEDQARALMYMMETLDLFNEEIADGGSPSFTMEGAARNLAHWMKDVKERWVG